MWIEALGAAKDLFPRVLTSSDFGPSEDVVVSTEKLRSRLQQEGIGETIIMDCESIMLSETSELQYQMKVLRHKHVLLLDTLRQLEVYTLIFLKKRKKKYFDAWKMGKLKVPSLVCFGRQCSVVLSFLGFRCEIFLWVLFVLCDFLVGIVS